MQPVACLAANAWVKWALSLTEQVSCHCAGPATRARAAALASAARQAAHIRPLVLDYLQKGHMPDTDAIPGIPACV